MTKNGIAWIREDFRIEHNPALSFASQNHENVVALYIYNKNEFDNKREAQKWWLYKSLEKFKLEFSKYKINLQILEGDELNIFSKIKTNGYMHDLEICIISKKMKHIICELPVIWKHKNQGKISFLKDSINVSLESKLALFPVEASITIILIFFATLKGLASY